MLLLLLLMAEIHAMVGFYRILVKWSRIHRHKSTKSLVYAPVFFVGLGFVGLVVFYFPNVKGLS